MEMRLSVRYTNKVPRVDIVDRQDSCIYKEEVYQVTMDTRDTVNPKVTEALGKVFGQVTVLSCLSEDNDAEPRQRGIDT